MTTKRQVLAYVRNRDAMSAAEKEELFSAENITPTIRIIKDLKGDIEAQFIAHEARMADMRGIVATAIRTDAEEPIRIQLGKDDDDEPIYEFHPPAIALDVFNAHELRWKVRTTRFLYLIESALEDALDHQGTIEDQRLSMLIAAVEKHRDEMEGDAEDLDEDLYAVAENLKSRTA